jgi:DNA-directed RNA polymerase subunit beta'
MMTKVSIVDGGDTQFLEGALEHKYDFLEENNRVFGLKVVVMLVILKYSNQVR